MLTTPPESSELIRRRWLYSVTISEAGGAVWKNCLAYSFIKQAEPSCRHLQQTWAQGEGILLEMRWGNCLWWPSSACLWRSEPLCPFTKSPCYLRQPPSMRPLDSQQRGAGCDPATARCCVKANAITPIHTEPRVIKLLTRHVIHLCVWAPQMILCPHLQLCMSHFQAREYIIRNSITQKR